MKGNYRSLIAFQKSECIYDITYYFAHHYLVEGKDRTVDQMVQAARSGKQNIAEGSSAATTSRESELKLINVAKASLQELLLDYEDWEGDTAPYTQRVEIDNMFDFFNPQVGLNPSASFNQAVLEIQEYSKLYNGVSGNGYIDFYAVEKPICDLSLTVKRL